MDFGACAPFDSRSLCNGNDQQTISNAGLDKGNQTRLLTQNSRQQSESVRPAEPDESEQHREPRHAK